MYPAFKGKLIKFLETPPHVNIISNLFINTPLPPCIQTEAFSLPPFP